jgi:predicted ATPase
VAEELVQNLTRARELCRTLHDDAMLVSVLVGLGRFYNLRANREAIEQLTAEELGLLERVQEPTLALQLHTQLGTSYLMRGVLVRAQEHYARALQLYDPQRHRELALRFGADPTVAASVLSGWSLWLAGWPDQARSRTQQGLSWATELNYAFSLSFALYSAAQLHLWCGELEEAERLAAESLSVAREYGVERYRVVGGIIWACIQIQQKEPTAGLSLLTEGLSQFRGMGTEHSLPLFLSSMAEAYRQLGRVEEALVTIAEAVRATETYTSVYWAAEVHRLKGELTLKQCGVRSQDKSRQVKTGRSKPGVINPHSIIPNPEAEAEACFLQAIAIARQQEAKSLELRAVVSLSRLWHHQGKRAEARKLLAETYGWFTEGFDTADLREAKAWLDTLGR